MPSKKDLEQQVKELNQIVAHQNMIIGGRKGGQSGRGSNKARPSSQARAAVNERWRRYRERFGRKISV